MMANEPLSDDDRQALIRAAEHYEKAAVDLEQRARRET